MYKMYVVLRNANQGIAQGSHLWTPHFVADDRRHPGELFDRDRT